MTAQPQRPFEKLQPGSWTEAEVDAIEGHRVRFKDPATCGTGEGTVKNAVGLRDRLKTEFVIHRSTAIGDIVAVDGEAFQRRQLGWERLDMDTIGTTP